MNTFGLRRKINTFWLGKLQFKIIDAWNEVVSFVLQIKNIYNFIGEIENGNIRCNRCTSGRFSS